MPWRSWVQIPLAPPFMSYAERREYMQEYQRTWVAARRAAWFADKYYVRCGSREDLELDHIDPSTKESHNIWSWSEVRRDAEIAKCQVLCKSCHLLKTISESQQWTCRRCGGRKNGSFRRSNGTTELRCLPCHREKEQTRKAKRKFESSCRYGPY